jgi:hypothetical protein
MPAEADDPLAQAAIELQTVVGRSRRMQTGVAEQSNPLDAVQRA